MTATLTGNPRTPAVPAVTSYSVARGAVLAATARNVENVNGLTALAIGFGTWTSPPVLGGDPGDVTHQIFSTNVTGYTTVQATDNGDGTSTVTVSKTQAGGASGVAAGQLLYVVIYDTADAGAGILALAGPFTVVA